MEVVPAGDQGGYRVQQTHRTTAAASRPGEGRNVSTVALHICDLVKAPRVRFVSVNDSKCSLRLAGYNNLRKKYIYITAGTNGNDVLNK